MKRIAAALALPVVRRIAATLVLSVAGASGIALHEGTVKKVYLDPVGIPTVCVGHTATVSHADVGKAYTDAQCAELLKADTAIAQRAVGRLVRVPVTQDQYDSLVSFTFNVGEGNFKRSTLLRKLNAGDCWGAVSEFPKWSKAKGRELPGLLKRRNEEAAKFSLGCT